MHAKTKTQLEAKAEMKSLRVRAFRMWLRRETGCDVEHAAAIIVDVARAGGSIADLLLTATGDSVYTRSTFIHAALIALDVGEEGEAK